MQSYHYGKLGLFIGKSFYGNFHPLHKKTKQTKIKTKAIKHFDEDKRSSQSQCGLDFPGLRY